jgi:hypothetical protein
VPAAAFGVPVLGDIAAAGWAGAKALAWKAWAWASVHPAEAVVGKAVAEEAIEATVTGTPFDSRMVALDILTQVGDDTLPRRQYSVAYEMELDPADYGQSRRVHFNRANAALDAAIQSDPYFAARMDELSPGVAQRVSSAGGRMNPKDFVWHHDQDAGVMQLVPKTQHYSGSPWWPVLHPGGCGGYSIWAIPNGAPPN